VPFDSVWTELFDIATPDTALLEEGYRQENESARLGNNAGDAAFPRTLDFPTDIQVAGNSFEQLGIEAHIRVIPQTHDGTDEPVPNQPLGHLQNLGYLTLTSRPIHKEHDPSVKKIRQSHSHIPLEIFPDQGGQFQQESYSSRRSLEPVTNGRLTDLENIGNASLPNLFEEIQVDEVRFPVRKRLHYDPNLLDLL